MRVTLSPDTEQDLIEIAAFIGADSPRRSMSFIDELQTLCASLATKPLRFAIIAERQSVSVRRAIQGRYSVFYVALLCSSSM
jgi:toxin ParE1/3/4